MSSRFWLPWDTDMRRKKSNRGPRIDLIVGEDFHLVREVRYIQRRAAKHEACFVTVGPLAFFSTDTGDAWMLGPSDKLAARLACDGDPEPIDFAETETNFAIDWKGRYRIECDAFIFTDLKSGRVTAILGYPTAKIAELV